MHRFGLISRPLEAVSYTHLWIAFLLSLLASFTIEVTQLAIGRAFDIDDIILNVVGGMLGFLFYYAITKLWSTFPKFLKSRWFLDTVSVLLLIVLLGVIYMVVLV